MKNTEIRIGNYIKRKGLVVQVDEQTFWDMKNNPEEYEPIELNKDWLYRLGFKSFDCFDGTKYTKNLIEVFKPLDENIVFIDYSRSGNNYFKYVHQLQNIYHALTLEELNLN